MDGRAQVAAVMYKYGEWVIEVFEMSELSDVENINTIRCSRNMK